MTDQRPDAPLDDLLHDPAVRDPAYELDAAVEAARAAVARDRRSHGWRVALAAAVLLIASAATVAAVRPEWLPRNLRREAATPAAPAGPTLLRQVPLRDAPRDDGASLLQVEAGTSVRVVGKSPDGRWLAAATLDRPDMVGWVPADAVGGLDLASVSTIAADPGARGTVAAPPGPVARPDLRVEAVYAKENRLFVSVLNAGPADARGSILASVDGAAPVPLEGKSDEGLRSGQRIQAAIVGAFVQIRGTVTVTISLSPPVAEPNQADNTFTGIVEPDRPTDLEIAAVERGASALVVTVRNNSTIPVTGTHTITVREAPPGTRLLGRVEQAGTVEAGGAMVTMFPDLREVDLTRVSITLSSDSIADAVLGNNTYPR